MTDKTIFKSRYNKYYLIDVRKRGKERFLLEEDSKDMLYFLFRSNSFQETVHKFKLSYKELYDFLLGLVKEQVIEFSNTPIDSTEKYYNINPPLDSLNLLITNACNLHCVHCYLNSGKAMESELDVEIWIDVLRQAQQLGVFYLNVSGGEPLLHKDFFKIAEYIASTPTFSANLNTNGTIDIDGYEKLLARAFTSIQLSIDDAIAEKHNTFRGCKGCFKKAVQTIEKLINHGIETNVGFLINSRNLSALDEVVRLCEQIGVTTLNIGFVNPIGRAKKNNLAYPIIPQSLQENKLLDKMYRKFCKLTERDTKLKILLPFQPRLSNNLSKNKHYICGGDNIQFMTVMADGTVMPCDVLPIDIFNYGNVKTQSLIDIWASDRMKAFKLMDSRQLSNCYNCPYFQICEGPCVARAFQAKKSLQSPDWIRCLITQKIVAENKKTI